MNSVSFFTNCYENDWEFVFKTDRLEKMIGNCNYRFQHKSVIINNVKNRRETEHFAQQAVNKKIIDSYYFSEDYSDEILKAFSIKRKSFVLDFYDGYWYSIAPLAAVYLCKTDYLLYFTCDCMIKESVSNNWIDKAIDKFKRNNSYFTANPLWPIICGELEQETLFQDEEWFYGEGFSDQCFLIDPKRLRGNFYSYYHRSAEAYPFYGGNPFERRVNNYMHKNNFIRLTNKTVHYTHEKLSIGANSKMSLKEYIKAQIAACKRKFRDKAYGFLKVGN